MHTTLIQWQQVYKSLKKKNTDQGPHKKRKTHPCNQVLIFIFPPNSWFQILPSENESRAFFTMSAVQRISLRIFAQCCGSTYIKYCACRGRGSLSCARDHHALFNAALWAVLHRFISALSHLCASLVCTDGSWQPCLLSTTNSYAASTVIRLPLSNLTSGKLFAVVSHLPPWPAMNFCHALAVGSNQHCFTRYLK